MNTSKKNYIKQIDGLRGISILSVILYHFFFDIFIGGFIGVDIFFVISGFVISKILIEEYYFTKTISIKNFLYKKDKTNISSIFFSYICFINIFIFYFIARLFN